MKRIAAGEFADLQSFLSALCQFLNGPNTDPFRIGSDQISLYQERLQRYRNLAADADLPLACGYADQVISAIERAQRTNDGSLILAGQSFATFRSGLDGITNTAGKELNTKLVFTMPSDKARFYLPPQPIFGVGFATKFARCAFDVDEAGNCFALGRYTAAVYHLMRILESGLHAIRLSLGLKTPLIGNDRNWGNILRDVRKAIDDRGPKWSERDRFSELHACLVSVKDAWRNETMHVGQKRTDEEAETILLAIKGLMQKIADRMDENGDPQV
jgi:Phosphotyrosyl phosphatase activator